jgi:TRAP-type C4-dicarboxylate transport system permease small subunit
MKVIQSFDLVLEKVSRVGLVSSLLLILGLSVLSVVLRWMGQSMMWMEPLIRHLVFLAAFLGGSLATSKNVHIRVDLLSKLVEASSSKTIHWFHRNLISLFCVVITAILTKSGWDFYLVEKEFGAPSFLDIHSAYLVGIIPVGMGLITLRFLNQFLVGLFSGDKIESHSVQ